MTGSRNSMMAKVALWALILMMAISAHAIPIHMDAGPLTVEAVEVKGVKAPADEDEEAEIEEGEEKSLSVEDFHLLGTSDEGLLIFADGSFFSIEDDALPEVVSQLGEARFEALPDVGDFEAIRRGGKGDEIVEIQQALVNLGYLSASADGQFGGKSQTAVSAFQKDMGLKETGTADELTQMLILSAQEAPVSIVQDFDPAMRYPELAGHTSANLSAVAEYGLTLEYDDIEGIGELGNGAEAEVDATEGPDLDSRMFELEFMLRVRQNGEEIAIEPVVQIRCECVRRPVMQALAIKAGDARCTVTITDLKTELSGPRSVEIATARLDADALRVLANAEDAEEFKFRIKCKYSEYDGEAEDTAAITGIGLAGLAL